MHVQVLNDMAYMHFNLRLNTIPSKHDSAEPTLKEEQGLLPNQTAYKYLTWLVGQQGPRATPANRSTYIVKSSRIATGTR
jgi:hypothetical protein